MGIGERIRDERKKQGIGPKALADRVGMSKSGLTDLEVGRSHSTTFLNRLADELGVLPSWLETGKGPRYPENNSHAFSPEGDVRPLPVRPDPAMLSSAYQWTLMGIGKYGGAPLRIALETDAAFVCDVYALIAQGNGVLPGGENSSELEAVIRRRATSQGSTENGKGTAASAEPQQQQHARKRT